MEITLSFSENPITHELILNNKIESIKHIREATNCDLRSAKDASEAIAKIITDLKPNMTVARTRITGLLMKHDKNTPQNLQFILDVLHFMERTQPSNLEKHDIPVPEYHSCGEECRHECEQYGCASMISFHDEPYCFKHSPDSGSSMRGYDSRNNNPF
jgi:hypothetical protein